MLLELKDIKKYFSHVRAVDGVSLKVEPGKNLGLVGESGSGKTTLGRLILKLIEPDGGQIIFKGEDISSFSSRQMRPLRPKIQMVFQDPYSSLDPRFTVYNILREACVLTATRDMERKMEQVLISVDLPANILNRFPHEFSGGERQRIAIARALMMNPELLILDEAVSSLDVLVQQQILDLLKKLQKEFELTYLFISHNLRVVKKICPEIAVMYQGKIVEMGETETIFKKAVHPYTQDLLSAALHYKASTPK